MLIWKLERKAKLISNLKKQQHKINDQPSKESDICIQPQKKSNEN